MTTERKTVYFEKYLRALDDSRRFLTYSVNVIHTDRDYVTVGWNNRSITITISDYFYRAPREVMEEVVEYCYRKACGEKVPKFGPKASRFLKSTVGGQKVVLRARKAGKDVVHLPSVVSRVVAEFPNLTPHLQGVTFHWRYTDVDLSISPVTNVYPDTKEIWFDHRLKLITIPPAVLEYIMYHELAVLASWDFSVWKLDKSKLNGYLAAHPRRYLVLSIIGDTLQFTYPI